MGYRKPYYDENHRLVRYTPLDFLRDTAQFFRRFFAFSNIKHAFRTVLTSMKEYLAFFVALTLLQSVFWMIWLYHYSYAKTVVEQSKASDFNLMIEGLTDDEWAHIFNESFRIADQRKVEERGYVSYTSGRYYGTYSEGLVRVSFLLTDDSKEACDSFLKRYKISGENLKITYGERTRALIKAESSKKTAVLLSLLSLVLAAFSITMIFRIRVNLFRFKYGIYMTFGADFEKLLEVAGWEVMVAAVLCFLPGLLLAVLILILCGGRFVFEAIPRSLLRAVLWLVSAVILGVIPSVRIIASTTPAKLIAAEDNSNLVSSPRRSFRIFGKSFPFHYELFGFWRFRKYYLTVIASAAVFSTFFFSGSFSSGLILAGQKSDKPQFVVTFGEGGDFDSFGIEELSDLDGVSRVIFKDPVSASAIDSHILLDGSQSAGISSHTVASGIDGLYADNNCRYLPIDEQLAREATKDGFWKVSGDLESVLNGDLTVAMTLSMNNSPAVSVSPGDVIRIGVLRTKEGGISYDRPDKKYILSQLIERAEFTYFKVTVGAVIEEPSSDGEYNIYLPGELYEKVTGRKPSYAEVSVYLSEDATAEKSEKLRKSVTNIASTYVGSHVEDTGRIYEKLSAVNGTVPRIITASAAFMLILSIPVWIFSQRTFAGKRKGEYGLLSALGADSGRLKKLRAVSGGMLALPAGFIPLLTGFLISLAIFRIVNVFLPSLGFGDGTNYTFSPDPVSVVAGAAVPALAAFLSTVLVKDRNEKWTLTEE